MKIRTVSHLTRHLSLVLALAMLLCACRGTETVSSTDSASDTGTASDTDTGTMSATDTTSDAEFTSAAETTPPADTAHDKNGEIPEDTHESTTETTAPTVTETDPADTQDPVTEIPPLTDTPSVETSVTDDATKAKIDGYLAAITENFSVSEQYMLEKNEETFAALTALGRDALPYLTELAEADGEDMDLTACIRRAAARHAAYRIAPELYEGTALSPDGKYCFRASPVTFYENYMRDERTVYDVLSVEDAATGETVLSAAADCTGYTLKWSADDRYLAVLPESEDGGTVLVFDVTEKDVTELPRTEFLNIIHRETGGTHELYSCSLYSFAWLTTSQIQVEAEVRVGVSYYNQSALGWYVYDLGTGTMTKWGYTLPETKTAEKPLSEAEVKRIFEENFAVLSDTVEDEENYYFGEAELIAAQPEAFAAIVALGDAALPYLTPIAQSPASFTTITRGLLAKILIYAIAPETYDCFFPSPDGTYTLRLRVGSFCWSTYRAIYAVRYDQASVLSAETGEVIMTANDYYTNPEVSWSPDARYCAVTNVDPVMFAITDVYALETGEVIRMPYEEIEKQIIAEQVPEYADTTTFYRFCTVVEEWISSDGVCIDTVKMQLSGMVAVAPVDGFFQEAYGYYLYDLVNRTVLEMQYTPYIYEAQTSAAAAGE